MKVKLEHVPPRRIMPRVDLEIEDVGGVPMVSANVYPDGEAHPEYGTSVMIHTLVRAWLPAQEDSQTLVALEADLKAALYEIEEHRRALQSLSIRRDTEVCRLEDELAQEILSRRSADRQEASDA